MKNVCKTVFITLVLIFLYAPILILTVYSFTDATTIGAIRGFSLHNYVTLFTTPELRDMIFGTITLALGAALLATVLGTLGAVGSFYSGKVTNSVITAVNQIPVVNADVVTGFSACILLVVVLGITKDTFIPLLAGHVTLCAPFVFLSVVPKLKLVERKELFDHVVHLLRLVNNHIAVERPTLLIPGHVVLQPLRVASDHRERSF